MNPPGASSIKGCWAGAAVILVFCGIGIAARGIHWDESYEHAQVLSGAVRYPPGHPLPQYVQTAFSVQSLVSALLMQAHAGAAALCAFRNFLFLAMSLLPVYVLAAMLTRSAVWGIAAAALMLQGILLEFDGPYPSMVWPELYSNGHIGGGFAVLAFALCLAQSPRWGGFLLGLVPGIHAGQAPPPFAGAALSALALRDARAFLRALAPLLLGLACTGIAFAAFRALYRTEPAQAAWWPVLGDAGAVWRGYTYLHDLHRALPPANGLLLVCGAALLSLLAVRAAPAQRVFIGVAVYCAVVFTVVIGTIAVQKLLGENTPRALVAWMPYRTINHLQPLLLALIVGILAMRPRGAALLALALLCAAAIPPLGWLLPHAIHARYVAQGDGLAFFLVGAAFAQAAGQLPLQGRYPMQRRRLLLLCICLGVACWHHFGAVCIAIGMSAERVAAWIPERTLERMSAAPVVVMLAIVIAAQAVSNQYQHRKHLPRSPFDVAVADAISAAPLDGRVTIAPPETYALQARTGAAPLVESATASLISYVPALGPRINALYHDLYGTRFDDGPDGNPDWREVWRKRTAAEWSALAARYHAQWVLAPADLALPLPPRVQTPEGSLYALPAARAAK